MEKCYFHSVKTMEKCYLIEDNDNLSMLPIEIKKTKTRHGFPKQSLYMI